jgi:2-keto-3-deoxy-L-rhamnonate aldolase RhmA
MIETANSVANVEDIAAVDGVDVLLIGSNDLAIELGVPGEFTSPVFRDALQKVSTACRKFEKTFGLAGIYDAPDIQGWAVSELGAGFMLVQQDSGILSGASRKAADAVLALTQAQP